MVQTSKEVKDLSGRHYRVSFRLQIFLIIITSIFSFAIFYRSVSTFKTQDVYPELISLTPQKVVRYGGVPVPVMVGLYIRDFPDFDMVKGKFTIDLTVWFKFNPLLISLERIGNFTFEMAKTEYKSDPLTRIEDKELVAYYDMRLNLNTHMHYATFPLDDHRLSIALAHYGLSPSDIMFTSSRNNLDVSPELSIAGWRYVDKRVKTGYMSGLENKIGSEEDRLHPRVIFSLDYERAGVRHIISIFVPLLLIFFLSLLTFSINPFGKNASSIMSISASAITALIAYRFVIENMSPPTGDFMASDYIFFLFLISACLIFFINISSRHITKYYKTLVVIGLHTAIIASLLYLVSL